MFALSLFAGNCDYYKYQAERYQYEANRQYNYEMKRRYESAAKHFWQQYYQCIENQKRNLPYKGYR